VRDFKVSIEWSWIAALALIAGAGPASASDWMSRHRGNEIQIYLDNDKWASSDRYYTNGLKIGFGLSAANIPGRTPTSSALDAFGRLLDCVPIAQGFRNGGFFVGQNMYTPRDVSVVTAQPFDRPWAGWLYAGVVLQASRKCAGSEALDTVELDVGVVGPNAQGEDVQNWWHRLIKVPESQGWENQIPNEPAFVLTYLHKQKWKWPGRENVEIIPHVGASLGTVMTLVRAGGMIRAGQHMTGFGPDRIEPGGSILQNFRSSKPCATWTVCEGYGFIGAEARAVAYNIFLDGTVFRDSPSVNRTPFVYDLTVGFSLRFDILRFTVTRVTRSEEFTTPVRGGGKQTFHSFNLGFEF
jgi:hypothetical protein